MLCFSRRRFIQLKNQIIKLDLSALKSPSKQILLQGHLLSKALLELLKLSLVLWSASKPVFGNLYLAPSNSFLVVLLTALLDNLIIITDGNFILLCFLDASPRLNDIIFPFADATIVFRNIRYRKKSWATVKTNCLPSRYISLIPQFSLFIGLL